MLLDLDDLKRIVSIGMAVYPSGGRTTQDLLETADQELYGRRKNSRITTGRGVRARLVCFLRRPKKGESVKLEKKGRLQTRLRSSGET